jgi:hypothetical protein
MAKNKKTPKKGSFVGRRASQASESTKSAKSVAGPALTQKQDKKK